MKTLDADIKAQQFSSLYLLYGEEAYLRRQYKEKLVKALVRQGDTMNYRAIEGKEFRQEEIVDLAETLPFFADRRVILLENSGVFLGKKEGGYPGDLDKLEAYLGEVSPSTCLIFVEPAVDKRNRLFKQLRQFGRVIEFPRQNREILEKWILSVLKREKKKITRDALDRLLDQVGNDMEALSRELEKLISFCLDKEGIEGKDVEALCIRQINDQIFAMLDALISKNQNRALALYYDLLALKEAPMRILALLGKQIRDLSLVQAMAMEGCDVALIADQLKMRDFIVQKYMRYARGFRREELENMLLDCVATEEAVKSGNLEDQLAVELLLVRYSA